MVVVCLCVLCDWLPMSSGCTPPLAQSQLQKMVGWRYTIPVLITQIVSLLLQCLNKKKTNHVTVHVASCLRATEADLMLLKTRSCNFAQVVDRLTKKKRGNYLMMTPEKNKLVPSVLFRLD